MCEGAYLYIWNESFIFYKKELMESYVNRNSEKCQIFGFSILKMRKINVNVRRK